MGFHLIVAGDDFDSFFTIKPLILCDILIDKANVQMA